MLIAFICRCCVDQIKRKSACPCKEGVGVGGSEKHGDNGTSIIALCCYFTLLCVEPTVWGARAIKGPNGCQINAPLPFNLVAIRISIVITMPFSSSWCVSCLGILLYLCLDVDGRSSIQICSKVC